MKFLHGQELLFVLKSVFFQLSETLTININQNKSKNSLVTRETVTYVLTCKAIGRQKEAMANINVQENH